MGDRTLNVLKRTLNDAGWRAGDTLIMDERYAAGDASRLGALAAELVALRPNAIGCTGVTEATALQAATAETPIVFMQVAVDPVAAGLVDDIARPGRNVTGCLQAPQLLSGKRLDILSELLGRPPRRLAYVLNSTNVGVSRLWADASEAASKIGADIVRAEVRRPDELDGVFEAVKGRDALLVHFDFMLVGLRERLAELAAAARVPVMYENQLHTVVGGLISYGPDLRDNYHQGAIYIDRVLRGVRPKDLPVIQGSRFELIINLHTARALGLAIPPTLLARADEVIE
jgi:putative ABC transport system substrate-binding protein